MVQFNWFKTPISFGWGQFDLLPTLLPKGRTFIVLGRGSARELCLQERLEKMIDVEMGVFSGVEPNPMSFTVEQGAFEIADFDPDLVVAVGGGSVMDAAKFMSVIAKQGGDVMEYLGGRDPVDGGYPVYAIPTTPGTSSEITPFSVVSVDRLKNKVGLRHPALYPEGAIIDPELTITLPQAQTAATGLDILSHAVESYWSSRSDPFTRELSLRAVSLVNEHLLAAFDNGSIREHREGISLASVFAGLAFSNTGTTVCHAISYPITFDTGLPHGMAVAMTLGPTYDILRSRGVKGLDRLAAAMGLDHSSFSDGLKDLLDSLKVPSSLSEAGFSGGLERVMSTDLTPLMKNLPVVLSSEDVECIVRSVL